MNKPLKRNKNLQPLSRDHHHSLLLCWKIRMGFKKSIDVQRIKQYADWFFTHHLQPHFEAEESYIFPILGMNHELIKRAMSEHRRLTRLFSISEELDKALWLIEEELEQHIRFEERILFNEIQLLATPEQLHKFNQHHTIDRFVENTEDEFWR